MDTEKQVTELLKQLIEIPSVNGDKEVDRCAAFIVQWLKSAGIQAEIISQDGVANVVASIGKKGGKKMLWNGHFDVVPAGDLTQWNTEPFKPFVKEGYLYGRGASDMKSGIAAMMLAMKELKAKEEKLTGEIVFWGIGDEETGSVHGTVQLLKEYDKEFDAAIVTEPTDFCLESAQRGLRWIEVHIHGKACHAGRPHVGKNAIEQAAKMIQALKDISYDISNNIFEEGLKEPSLSVNKITGGIQNNIIAEECTFLIDRRMLPGETAGQVLQQIETACESVREEGFVFECKMINDGWDPYMIEQNEPVLLLLEKYFEQVTGIKPVVRGKGGCTDASHIFKAGIPVVIFGAGSANESHTANEKVSLQKLAQSVEILVRTATEFLS